ncbi:MAG: hypothetical protein R2704_15560 [Microthrixaceae bacterium]
MAASKNENSNRQLSLVPKGTDLHDYSQADYDQACAVLNDQPRRQLAFNQQANALPASRAVTLNPPPGVTPSWGCG